MLDKSVTDDGLVLSDALREIRSALEEYGEKVSGNVERIAKALKRRRAWSLVLWGLPAIAVVAGMSACIMTVFKNPVIRAAFMIPVVIIMFFGWRFRVRGIRLPARLPAWDYEADLKDTAHLIWDSEKTEDVLRNSEPVDFFEIRHKSLKSAYKLKRQDADRTDLLGHFLVLRQGNELFTVFTEYHHLEVVETDCKEIRRARRGSRTCVIDPPAGYSEKTAKANE